LPCCHEYSVSIITLLPYWTITGPPPTTLSTLTTLTTLTTPKRAHQGFAYIPLGYATVFPLLANLDEVHGGSAWGAGTFAVSQFLNSVPTFPDNYRVPTALANPLPLSSRLLRPRVRPFMNASPGSSDYMAVPSRSRRARPLLLRCQRRPRLPSSRVLRSQLRRRRTTKDHVVCPRSVSFNDCILSVLFPLAVLPGVL
jgi:hypothetical protein